MHENMCVCVSVINVRVCGPPQKMYNLFLFLQGHGAAFVGKPNAMKLCLGRNIVALFGSPFVFSSCCFHSWNKNWMIMPWHQGCLLVQSRCVCMHVCMYICVCMRVCVCLCVKVSYIRPKIRNQITKPKYIQIHRHSLKSWHRNVGHAVAKWFVLLPNTATSTKSVPHCLDE